MRTLPGLPRRHRPIGSARLFVFGALASGLLQIACSGTTASFSFTQTVTYQKTPKANYLLGMSELKDENFEEAGQYFTYVKNKFPFSVYATLSELRLADAYFGEEKYADAIDAYRQFQKFHPTHAEVVDGYVSYRICHAYVKQIPSDWFLVPPSHEKDQSATKDALRELQSFMQVFTKSPHLAEAKKLHRECIRFIADHELYVARFYLDREKPQATIFRLEGLLKQYPDAGLDPEVMLLLGKTYLSMKQHDKARQTFTRLASQYPDDPHGAKAKLYLDYMKGTPQ